MIEKGRATPQLAQAIGEALDITLKAADLVTVPVLDARFAQHEARMEVRFGVIEARFSGLERALESTKVWAVLRYAGLVIAGRGSGPLLSGDPRFGGRRRVQWGESDGDQGEV